MLRNILQKHPHQSICKSIEFINAVLRGDHGMFKKCPGTEGLRTPTLKLKNCPECGKELEIFSTDVKVACSNCGFVVYNDIESCIQWCRYAKECVGEKLYKILKKDVK